MFTVGRRKTRLGACELRGGSRSVGLLPVGKRVEVTTANTTLKRELTRRQTRCTVQVRVLHPIINKTLLLHRPYRLGAVRKDGNYADFPN